MKYEFLNFWTDFRELCGLVDVSAGLLQLFTKLESLRCLLTVESLQQHKITVAFDCHFCSSKTESNSIFSYNIPLLEACGSVHCLNNYRITTSLANLRALLSL